VVWVHQILQKNKSETFIKIKIFINMGRKLKKEEDRKIKFGISLDPDIFNLMVKEKIKKSTLIEKLLKEYYDKKNL
jgi:hypothetical protein